MYQTARSRAVKRLLDLLVHSCLCTEKLQPSVLSSSTTSWGNDTLVSNPVDVTRHGGSGKTRHLGGGGDVIRFWEMKIFEVAKKPWSEESCPALNSSGMSRMSIEVQNDRAFTVANEVGINCSDTHSTVGSSVQLPCVCTHNYYRPQKIKLAFEILSAKLPKLKPI